MECFIPVLIVGSMVAVSALFNYYQHVNAEEARSNWRHLADRHEGLTFHAPPESTGIWKSLWAYLFHISEESYLSGMYQDSTIKLETFGKPKGKSSETATRCTVSLPDAPPLKWNRPDQALTGAAVTELLLPDGFRNITRLRGDLTASAFGTVITYEQTGIESDFLYLEKTVEFMCDIVRGYPAVLALGGDAVPALRTLADGSTDALRPIIIQLLRDIGSQTTSRYQTRQQRLLCPNCLTQPAGRKVRLSWLESITYIGCRMCGQSSSFLEGQSVAVLDQQMSSSQIRQNGQIRINWLDKRTLFDFAAIEIVQASDEEVERLVVQVGNDTDAWRQRHIDQVQCFISPQANLSQNTLRLIRKQFGQITKLSR